MTKTRYNDLSDEVEARIQAGIATDVDNPELTDEQLASMRPFAEVYPDIVLALKRSRGRPRVESPRKAITLRVSPETLARFKATGPDWRARMTNVLEQAMDDQTKSSR